MNVRFQIKPDENPLKITKSSSNMTGTPCGWQVQAKGQSIQGVLQEALRKLTKEKISVMASGRTDAGVHALGQVAHFKSRTARPMDRFQYALNAMIAPAISVKSMEEVPLEFHAQRDAKSKLYSYLVLNHGIPSVFLGRFSWQVPKPLNWDAIHAALEVFVGEHDFKSFQSVGTDLKSTVRKIHWVKIEECFKDHPHLYAIQMEANGFLKQMVRNIVGTVIQVGQGRLAPKEIKRILEAKDRRKAGPAAPSRGLFLLQVNY
jgi:tRNA pseudouridine38-40 synthase